MATRAPTRGRAITINCKKAKGNEALEWLHEKEPEHGTGEEDPQPLGGRRRLRVRMLNMRSVSMGHLAPPFAQSGTLTSGHLSAATRPTRGRAITITCKKGQREWWIASC
jgi:hypothetical protein